MRSSCTGLPSSMRLRARLHRQLVVGPHRLVPSDAGEERLAPARVAGEVVRLHRVDEHHAAGLGQQAVDEDLGAAGGAAHVSPFVLGLGVVGVRCGRRARRRGRRRKCGRAPQARATRWVPVATMNTSLRSPAREPRLRAEAADAQHLGGGRRTGRVVDDHQEAARPRRPRRPRTRRPESSRRSAVSPRDRRPCPTLRRKHAGHAALIHLDGGGRGAPRYIDPHGDSLLTVAARAVRTASACKGSADRPGAASADAPGRAPVGGRTTQRRSRLQGDTIGCW